MNIVIKTLYVDYLRKGYSLNYIIKYFETLLQTYSYSIELSDGNIKYIEFIKKYRQVYGQSN